MGSDDSQRMEAAKPTVSFLAAKSRIAQQMVISTQQVQSTKRGKMKKTKMWSVLYGISKNLHIFQKYADKHFRSGDVEK